MVPGDVARQVAAITVPAGVALRFGLQPGALAIKRHHPIRFQLEQIVGIQILRLFEWSACQPHGGQWQRTRNIGNGVFDLLGLGERRNQQGGKDEF